MEIRVARGDVPCARCGLLIDPSQEWDLGHSDDDPTLYSGPEHRHARDCPEGGNRATLTHARALEAEDKEDYTDDPKKGAYWGPPSIDRPFKPIRWSRPRDVSTTVDTASPAFIGACGRSWSTVAIAGLAYE